jgi:hypothetical protein
MKKQIAPQMTVEELIIHKDEIQRQAIPFYKAKENMLPGIKGRERWRKCINMIAGIWRALGPQKDSISEEVIHLPEKLTNGKCFFCSCDINMKAPEDCIEPSNHRKIPKANAKGLAPAANNQTLSNE